MLGKSNSKRSANVLPVIHRIQRTQIHVLECDAMTESDKSQSDKFKEAARENEADEDEARWEARLRRVTKGRDARVPPPPGPLREKPEKSG
jgi:hypothetical protein